MRVIVTGSRRWHDRKRITDRLYELPPGSTIVHGDARGADRIAEDEGQKLGHYIEAHPAARFRTDKIGPKVAPLIRNEHMARLGADQCIAFWDGRSSGTAHMISMAKRYDIPVEIVKP